MKPTNMKLAIVAASLGVVCGSAALAEGVSVRIGEPGFYGRLELGDAPKPVLVSPSPVIIEREHPGTPAYVYVPAEQQRDWANNCSKYAACGRPVYFVEERWYNDVYVPHYRSKHEIRKEAKESLHDAKREAKEAKHDAKREYKEAKHDAGQRE